MRWLVLFLVFPFATTSALAHGPDAWWIICDSCNTDTQFRYAAHEAPVDGIVFVSNGNSGVTQKFERWTFIEDAPGEIIVSVVINDLPIPEAQAAVLNRALEKSRRIVVPIPRDSITGLDTVDSILGDVHNGRLSAGFTMWLRVGLINRGLFPSPQSVSGEVGATIGGVTIRDDGSPSGQIRTHPLMAVVTYPDGSRVTITFSQDSETILEVMATDTDGTELPIAGINSDGSIGLDREGFMGREFAFGSPADQLLDWLNAAAHSGAPNCRAEVTEDGMRVICERT